MYDPKSLSKRADQKRLGPIPKVSKNKRVRQRSPLRAEDILLVKHVEPKTAGASAFSVKDNAIREQKKKLVNKRVKRESKLKPLFELKGKENSEVVKGSEAPGLDKLRVWFPNINEEEWLRLRALNAHGKPDKTSVCKSFDPRKSIVNMTERCCVLRRDIAVFLEEWLLVCSRRLPLLRDVRTRQLPSFGGLCGAKLDLSMRLRQHWV